MGIDEGRESVYNEGVGWKSGGTGVPGKYLAVMCCLEHYVQLMFVE